jgi:Spy/CpxP family protein refolding chaperone
VRAAARQRARRAVRRLKLTPAQAETVRRHLQDDRRRWEAARVELAGCRRALARTLVGPAPDSSAVLELTIQERLLEDRERALAARVEERMAGLLSPDQAVRLHALAPDALGDVLVRLCA